jgi:hypothetical protein
MIKTNIRLGGSRLKTKKLKQTLSLPQRLARKPRLIFNWEALTTIIGKNLPLFRPKTLNLNFPMVHPLEVHLGQIEAQFKDRARHITKKRGHKVGPKQ